jgi:ABC-2 type transport system ATP-binding protein
MELKINNLSKTYANGICALKHVGMNIPNGMFGLLGPNGAGKSTLMRTIATLQTPDEGEIDFNGVNVLMEKDQTRRMLGYLPQEFGVYAEVTAERMLHHIAVLKGIGGKKQREEAVNRLLQQTNLFTCRKRKLGSFSGGMKQRFGIAQALLGNPQLLIVDEPTAGLDPEERNRFLNILSDISEKIIVILSTHIVEDVMQLCSRMAILNNGVLVLSGKTAGFISQLQGKIWQKTIKKNESAEYDNAFRIVYTRMLAGEMEIHVFAPSPPAGFQPVHPDLEDVYFTSIKNIANLS